jgi:hypothetical protein
MFRQIDEAAELSLEEAMQMEYRVGVRLLTSPGEGPVVCVVHVADVCVLKTPLLSPLGFAWETEENADPSISSALKGV